MKLIDLIKIADAAYPDGLIMQAYVEGKKFKGDTLAKFIALELTETFNEKAPRRRQLDDAAKVLYTASDEICAVIDAIDTAVWDKPKKAKK
jgi:hypothetical protein